jgi:FAD-linked oxidoreductase
VRISNWSGNVHFEPAMVARPTNTSDVVDIVKSARSDGRKIRVMGSKHSFSPLIESNDILVDMSLMSGMVSLDQENRLATFLAGTPIHVATESLYKNGLSLANQGDIDRQTLAGAFSTGTHGTGLAYASLAGFIQEMEFVDGNGLVHVVNENSSDDLLNACRVNFGTFGISTRFTIKCVDAHLLRNQSRNLALEEILTNIEGFAASNQHFEFFWFPYSNVAQVKTCNPATSPNPRNAVMRFLNEKLLERALFGAFCRTATWFPVTAPAISRFCGAINPATDFTEPSHRVFPSERNVIFTEMEYALPLEFGVSCFREIKNLIEEKRIPVFFPVEFRVAGPDTVWVSPMHGRRNAIISIHVFRQFAMKEIFNGAQVIFKKYGGRPHWGKVHDLTHAELASLYPNWGRFSDVRDSFDPDRIFLNPMLNKYFPG